MRPTRARQPRGPAGQGRSWWGQVRRDGKGEAGGSGQACHHDASQALLRCSGARRVAEGRSVGRGGARPLQPNLLLGPGCGDQPGTPVPSPPLEGSTVLRLYESFTIGHLEVTEDVRKRAGKINQDPFTQTGLLRTGHTSSFNLGSVSSVLLTIL